jgi:hypothetical protein
MTPNKTISQVVLGFCLSVALILFGAMPQNAAAAELAPLTWASCDVQASNLSLSPSPSAEPAAPVSDRPIYPAMEISEDPDSPAEQPSALAPPASAVPMRDAAIENLRPASWLGAPAGAFDPPHRPPQILRA